MNARIVVVCLLAAAGAAWGTEPKKAVSYPPVEPTPGRLEAMEKVKFMRGVWAGQASGTSRDGTKFTATQVERMGPMLGGDVLVIEGRGYRPDGSTGFNALAVVSWDPMTKKFEMRSYAMGYAGTFELKLTEDGYVWETPAGPGAVMRYSATVKGDTWREVGDYVAAGQAPIRTFEMNLKRVGDTDWPLGTPVGPEVAKPAK